MHKGVSVGRRTDCKKKANSKTDNSKFQIVHTVSVGLCLIQLTYAIGKRELKYLQINAPNLENKMEELKLVVQDTIFLLSLYNITRIIEIW